MSTISSPKNVSKRAIITGSGDLMLAGVTGEVAGRHNDARGSFVIPMTLKMTPIGGRMTLIGPWK
jgi:hypothetical protein